VRTGRGGTAGTRRRRLVDKEGGYTATRLLLRYERWIRVGELWFLPARHSRLTRLLQLVSKPSPSVLDLLDSQLQPVKRPPLIVREAWSDSDVTEPQIPLTLTGQLPRQIKLRGRNRRRSVGARLTAERATTSLTAPAGLAARSPLSEVVRLRSGSRREGEELAPVGSPDGG
jgi:hypothetical protein